jgi:hypothetical protein
MEREIVQDISLGLIQVQRSWLPEYELTVRKLVFFVFTLALFLLLLAFGFRLGGYVDVDYSSYSTRGSSCKRSSQDLPNCHFYSEMTGCTSRHGCNLHTNIKSIRVSKQTMLFRRRIAVGTGRDRETTISCSLLNFYHLHL